MRYDEASERLQEFRSRIKELHEQMRHVQEETEPQEVQDYALTATDGSVAHLSNLFGPHAYLFVVHNMGSTCPYCTTWADGFNGVLDHLESRAAFVVSSPDDPETQRKFADGRGWRFRMVSHAGTSFAEDMGYRRDGGWWPGVSVFRREGNRILRVGDTEFGPGDDFCSVFHLFGLLPEGVDDWEPRLRY